MLTSSSGDITGDIVGNSGNGDVVFFNNVAVALFSIVAVVDIVNKCGNDNDGDDTGADDDNDDDGNISDVRHVAASDEDSSGNDVKDTDTNGDDVADCDNDVDEDNSDVVICNRVITVASVSIVVVVSVVNGFDTESDDDNDIDNITAADANVNDGGNEDCFKGEDAVATDVAAAEENRADANGDDATCGNNDVDAAATDVVSNDKQGNDAAVAVSVRECKIPLSK